METIPPIPEKWAVWRYDKNYEDVNKYFNWLYGSLTLIYKDQSYIHFPRLVDGSSMHSHLQERYTEITTEQFRKYILPIMEERMDKLEVGDIITKSPKIATCYDNLLNMLSPTMIFVPRHNLIGRKVVEIKGEYFRLEFSNRTWHNIADFVKPGYIPDTQTKQTPIMNTEQPISRYRTKVDLPALMSGTEGIYDSTTYSYKFRSLYDEKHPYVWYSVETVKDTRFFEPVEDVKTIEVGNPKVIVTIKGNEVKAEGNFGVFYTIIPALMGIVDLYSKAVTLETNDVTVSSIHIGCNKGIDVTLDDLRDIIALSGQNRNTLT